MKQEPRADVRRITPGPAPARVGGTSLIAGVLVALLVLAVGSNYVLGRPVSYEATSSFVLFPKTGNPQTQAGYFETLARGQIVSTTAQIVGAQQTGEDEVLVQVVPETSVITLTASAASAEEAEAIAARQLAAALLAVEELAVPFAARTVSTGAGTAVTADAGTTTLIGVVVFVALALGLLVQESLAALRRRQRRAAGLA